MAGSVKGYCRNVFFRWVCTALSIYKVTDGRQGAATVLQQDSFIVFWGIICNEVGVRGDDEVSVFCMIDFPFFN